MSDRALDDAVPILAAIRAVPLERRMDAVAVAVRAALDIGWLRLLEPTERAAVAELVAQPNAAFIASSTAGPP